MKIKVCGLTEATDMEGLLSADLDYLGFICYPKSKRWIAESTIAQKKYGNAKKVGVFVNETKEKVIEIAKKNNFDLLQLHGDESPVYCDRLREIGVQVIKVFGVDDRFDFTVTEKYGNKVDYFLFDTKGAQRGGNGYPFNWEKLHEYKGNAPFVSNK
ncbi:MAG: phosphoribosylanthranilate isomerase, partial [Cyclobacteriaceae bacterium]|nr:phosphoribosylanthranilate isomerase [Cyclobacteriaceae bacterium]